MVPGIDPKVDYAFKRLFGSPHNTGILISLLHAVLRPKPAEQIVDLQVLNPFNDKEGFDDKLSVVDLKARDQSGRHYTIEMQLLLQRQFTERILYYWARLYQSQLHEGDDYNRLQPAISVVLLDDVLFADEPALYHRAFRLYDEAQRLLTTHLVIHLIELPKFTRGSNDLGDALDQWVYFFRHAATLDTERLPTTLAVPEIGQALQELRAMTEIEQERERYEARLKAQRDARWLARQPELAIQEAHEKGRAEGLLKARWIISIQACQDRLGRPRTADHDLLEMPLEELKRLAESLEAETSGGKLAQP